MEAEHELLHDVLHQLQSALVAKRREAIAELLGRFKDVANLHFTEEQSLMRLHGYPGYEAHQQEHDELLGELGEVTRRITAGELADARAAAETLEDWLTLHMHASDAALERYIEEEGIRPE